MSPGRAAIRQGTHPVEAKKSLAERGLEERNSASRLLEGETFVGGDGYRYAVVSTFPDGSIPVRRSDGVWNHYAPLLCEAGVRVSHAGVPGMKAARNTATGRSTRRRPRSQPVHMRVLKAARRLSRSVRGFGR
jgi:hypothetical protein